MSEIGGRGTRRVGDVQEWSEGRKFGLGETKVDALSLDVIQWRTRTLKRT